MVGLGNPGERFVATRHNVGADAAQCYASHHGGDIRVDRRRKAHSCEINVDRRRVVVAIPTTFMNESGMAVRELIKRHGITDALGLVVLHDELDLEPGRVKLKLGGGTAGHNGLGSIKTHIKSLDFLRIRIGIGKPSNPESGASWVLKRPSPQTRQALDAAVERVVSTLDVLVRNGVEAAMNIANAPVQ